ncbi:MAG: ribose 1,5-bisphosphate isomerase [Candidatus Methanofastidiosia archaeon]
MNDYLRKVAKDIETMNVRGAGRIAVAAAKALKVTASESTMKTPPEFIDDVKASAKYLVETRPTAVSLPNAVRFVLKKGLAGDRSAVDDMKQRIEAACDEFIENAERALDLISEFGARRIVSGDKIITVCNSNAAIAIMKRAHEEGKEIEIYAMETRPRFQGRITAKVLAEAGIKVNLIVDSAARHFMKDMDHLIVGADAVAANGAVVNKIGTASAALAAHEARVRMMVAAETFKFHPETIMGELVEIEERSKDEVLPKSLKKIYGNINIRNPVFDITPPEYVDVIVTERGMIPPQASFFLLTEQFGWRLAAKEPWE